MGGQLPSKAHVKFQQFRAVFVVACKLPCAVVNLNFHDNLQCLLLTKIPLFVQWRWRTSCSRETTVESVKALKPPQGRENQTPRLRAEQTWVNSMNLFFNRFVQSPTPDSDSDQTDFAQAKWWFLTCGVSCELAWLKVFPHGLQEYGLSRVWVAMCACWLNIFHIVLQIKGFSPVWVLTWTFQVLFSVKVFTHALQEYGFSPVWTFMWTVNWLREIIPTCFKNIVSHLCGFSGVNSIGTWTYEPLYMCHIWKNSHLGECYVECLMR